MSPSILLVTYQFCPRGGIGTRRWSKFAKYLTRDKGLSVQVLTARYPYQDSVNWCHDVEDLPGLNIHRISAKYPNYLLRPARNTVVKVGERVLKRTFYPIDIAQQWGTSMRQHAERLIRKHHIRHLIITGPPFTPLSELEPLKQRFPDLSILMDYRDPWIFWVEKQKGANTPLARMVEKREKQIMAAADRLMFTTPEIRDMYSQRFPEATAKTRVLPNAFDPDDRPENQPTNPTPRFHFVYAGTLLANRSKALGLMIEVINELQDPFFTQEMRIDLYGYKYNPPTFSNAALRKIYDTIVTHRGAVPPSSLFRKMGEYPFALLINVPERPGIIPAKTYDYIGLGRNIFLIAPPGALTHFIQDIGQYTAEISKHSIRETLLRMKADYQEGHTVQISEAIIRENAYPAATEQLLTYLRETGFVESTIPR